MDAQRVLQAVGLIETACSRMDELRKRRIGNRTQLQLADEWKLASTSIRAAGTPYEQGIFLAQKSLLFNHDHLLNSLGNLHTMLVTLIQCAQDTQVQDAIAQSNHDLAKSLHHLDQANALIAEYRAVVETHERMLAQGLEGITISLDDLEDVEQQLLEFTDWEHKVIGLGKAAAGRLKQHPSFASLQPETANRMAAALVLSLASTIIS